MIRVLIVDDSPTARRVLTRELDAQPDFTVVGAAADAFEARQLVLSRRPDVLTLDLQMPGMGGLEFLRKLMAHHPLPVVVVSSLTADSGNAAVEALGLGAVEVVGKARLGSDASATAPLVAAIRAAGMTSMHRRALRTVHDRLNAREAGAPARIPNLVRSVTRDVIAIGASTGGTRAIELLLRQLPAGMPGIVIAQHLPAAFTASFAARLNAMSGIAVREAKHGDLVEPGVALVAPGGCNLTVVRIGRQLRAHVAPAVPGGPQAPSVDALFGSVAAACGAAAVGVVLTGMGSDGASGLDAMRTAGAFTIAEHASTCAVYGMPRAAIMRGAATATTPLHQIPALLTHLLGRAVSTA